MGRQSEAIINHFSHPHPLHLTSPQSSQTCSACKQITLQTQPIYTCKSPSCTTTYHHHYSLHLKCSQLPPRITHPCHHNHPLSVVTRSSAANPFTCRACGTQGDGFSYSCKECDVNIHVVCAQLPLVLSHRSHFHQLKLVFSLPYGSNIAFSCDVCGVIGGSNCWLYRCDFCGFDAHLSCATSNAQSDAGGGGRSSRNDQSTLFLNPVNNQRDQYLQAMMGNGGGGNGNNQIMQALMGCSGGGGGNPLLQTILGSGGGGMNSQILQTILGGGGGGGGLDLSSVVGNVGDLSGLMGAGFGF